MATGRATQLTRQIGEHLVAAKLGRMGYIATPFAGNVPAFDLLVADQEGYAIPLQVKAINGGGWQFRADHFLNIDIVDEVQTVRGTVALVNPDLVCVLVVLKEDERDEFYLLRLRDLQAHFRRTYKEGRRPKNPQSLHCAVWPRELQKYRDRWDVLKESFAKTRKARSKLASP